MQSLGENTLQAFLNPDSFLSGGNNNVKNSKFEIENSDVEKYFKDIGSFSCSSSINSRSNSTGYKPALDIVVIPKKLNTCEEKENKEVRDSLNESLELTQRNRRCPRLRSRKKITEANIKQNEIPPEKKIRKNSESLVEIKLSTNTNNILSLSTPEQRSKNEKTRSSNSEIEIPSIITTQDELKLEHWGLPLTILRKYESRGVSSMFPWQVQCLKNPQVIEKYQNLVYSAPTSAGKTLVSEILVIKNVLERRKKVIFVLPFVSVVREKMYYFQDLLVDSGVRVEGFMGGVHPPGGFANTDVAIATIEKANSLVNQLMEDNELNNVGAVVIDELHLLGDSHRGYLLELLLTKLKYMNLKKEDVHVQLIGMSATLPNLNVLAKWLDAELFRTDFRPVPLQELCKIGMTIYDNKLNILRELQPLSELSTDSDNVFQLCFETISDGHSVLIFCPTKNWCENLAQQISKTFFLLGREETTYGRVLRDQLNTEMIMETLEQLKRTPVGLDKVLENTVSFGVAFHHAGLTIDERDVIEGAFRSGALRVLTATSTLSSGVNLPARRVIVRTPLFHGKAIDTLIYKQMIGRAGRMGKDTAGESILVCKPCEKSMASNILNSTLQPIESCLQGPCPLIRALLEAIASEVAYTHEDITTYMKCSLLSFTNTLDEVEKSTSNAIEFLVQNELLLVQTTESDIKRWVATPLGKACLAAAVPPKDGLFLFEELQKARQCFVLDTELHVIYLVTPFNSGSFIGQIDWYIFLDLWRTISESERRVGQLVGVKESYLVSALRGAPKRGKLLEIHKRFYTALALYDLVREVPLHTVCSKYNCCRGIIQSLQQSASTFAGMVTQFCKKLGWNCIELLVSQFQARLQFGVCRELLDLLRLPMLNGLRARSLFKEGITTVAELAMANELDVERALHNALPFESEKQKNDEDEDETERRNKMRTVFVTGKDGLTPKMAAIMLVKEARILVQNELGLEELLWNKIDKLKQDRPISASIVYKVDIETLNIPKLSPSLSNHSNISNKNCDDQEQTEVSVNLNNISNKTTDKKQTTPVKVSAENLECNRVEKIVDDSYVTKFKEQTSYSRSPSLFGDSLIIDTQECNILEQNVIGLDSKMFDDTVFSVLNSPTRESNGVKTKNKEVVNPVLPNESRQLTGTVKSIVWEEDTWHNSKVIVDDLKKLDPTTDSPINFQKFLKNPQTPPMSRSKIIEVTPKSETRLRKLNRIKKRSYNSPDVMKSPIASFLAYEATRRLSTGSNKSEDDIVIESQPIKNLLSGKKTRSRMKLETLKVQTQKIASKTQILSEKIENMANVNKEVLKTQVQLKRLKKLENHKKYVPKELSIVDISTNQISFNEFKRKIDSRKNIALALSCEIFPTGSTVIGTKIIEGGEKNYNDIKKKWKKNNNGVYNDKKLCGVSISWGRTVYYLPFENVQEPTRIPIKERITLLANILTTPDMNVRCYATKEIYKTLYKCCGLSPTCKFLDSSIADWLINSDYTEKTFGSLINEYLPKGLTLLQRLNNLTGSDGPGMNVRSFVSGEIRACTEALLSWHLLQNLLEKLEALDPILLKTFHEVEMETLLILSRMELTGISVNLTSLQELSRVICQELSTLENKGFELAGKKFNFSSSRSVAQILGLDKGKKVSTNKAVLEQSDHPIAKIIMNWRKINAAFVKMVCPLLALAERHSRIFSNCVMNTVTGRISMHEPNLQNVPRDFNSADNSFIISIRMAFVPALGNVLISADYCQLELRILAHFSKEKKLCSVLKKPGDVFKNIAARWYNTLETEINDTMRQRTKQLCYGMIYGMSVKTLAETLQVEELEAQQFLKTFMGTYPGIQEWLRKTVEEARASGFITTLMKRRRMLPGIKSEINSERRQAERQAINSTIQGSAADIAKMAMVLVDEKIQQNFSNMPMVLPEMTVKRKLRRSSETLPRGAYLVLQLHDELLYEVNALDLDCVVNIIKKSMENVYSLDIPLPVKIRAGPAWGDLTEYNFNTFNE